MKGGLDETCGLTGKCLRVSNETIEETSFGFSIVRRRVLLITKE